MNGQDPIKSNNKESSLEKSASIPKQDTKEHHADMFIHQMCINGRGGIDNDFRDRPFEEWTKFHFSRMRHAAGSYSHILLELPILCSTVIVRQSYALQQIKQHSN